MQPHARPADVRLAYKGATHLSLDADRSLLVGTPMGVLRDAPPPACQTIDGVQVPVESRYVVNQKHRGDAEYGFVLGAGYRADRELIIDPGVEFTTFLGGSSDEQVGGIRVDAAGNTYIAGTTQSPDFPTRAGSFRRTGAASNFGDVSSPS